MGRHYKPDVNELYEQIELARKFDYTLGIAVDTVTWFDKIFPEKKWPNSIIYSSPEILKGLALNKNIRIETDGEDIWTYASIDYKSDDIKPYIPKYESRDFGFEGSFLPYGTIYRDAVIPCYPSIVLGKQIKLLESSALDKILMVSSAKQFGIHFDTQEFQDNSIKKIPCDQFTENLTHADLIDNQDEEAFCLTPDEDEELFNRTIKEYESRMHKKVNHKNDGESNSMGIISTSENTTNTIRLDDILSRTISNALNTIKKNLPYDDITVGMAFMTGVASMLKMETKVCGNRSTNYMVPINLYTAIVAKSGRKKTPLQNFFVHEPAQDVLRKVARDNEMAKSAWEASNRGIPKKDRTPPPVPVDIRINDYTGEALVVTLAKLDTVGRAILIARDELNGLFESLNSYRKGADEQQLLELYDGNGYRSLRQSDTTRGYQRSAVNILGAVQPEVLEKLIQSGDANGMWARFTFVPMPDETKKLPTEFNEQEQKELNESKQMLVNLMTTIYNREVTVYDLDREAVEVFSEYELKKQEDAILTKVTAQGSLYGKSAGKVLRIAGILHILWDYASDFKLGSKISATTLRNAINIIEYLDNWMLACHAKSAGIKSKSYSDFTRRIHEIALKSTGFVSWTNIREQMSSHEKKNKTKDDAEESMRQLVGMQVGEISTGTSGGLRYKALKPLSE